MCGLHFTLQLNIILKFESSNFYSVIFTGIEFIYNFKNNIVANLRRRRVWTTCLKDEVLTCGSTGHPSLCFFVPFCKKNKTRQKWRMGEMSVRNIARIETGHLSLNNQPLGGAVGKYKLKAIRNNDKKTEVDDFGMLL